MAAAEVLRQLASAEAAAAFSAGAEALEERPKLVATIAGLETTVDDLRRQLEEATRPPARFPGDPGPGRIVVGAATSKGNVARVELHEKATGRGLARRRYDNGGIADFTPGGPIARKIAEDVAAHRLPVPSGKPGLWHDIAAGRFDATLRPFFAWCESSPGIKAVIVNHEPQNDVGKLGTAGEFRGSQQRIRAILDAVAGGRPKRTSFGGSLMAYGWTTQGIAKFGPVDDWNPGRLPDGRHVWDWCGLDQYAQNAGLPIIDAKYRAGIASLKAWGVVPALTEIGIRDQDPDAARKLADLYEQAIDDGCALFLYYDSDVNSTQDGWVMDDTNGQLSAFHGLMRDPRSVNPNA